MPTRRITATLPPDLVDWLDEVSPSSRSRQIEVACEFYRLCRVATSIGCVIEELDDAIPQERRGRKNLLREHLRRGLAAKDANRQA